jgi:hypothetical protein
MGFLFDDRHHHPRRGPDRTGARLSGFCDRPRIAPSSAPDPRPRVSGVANHSRPELACVRRFTPAPAVRPPISAADKRVMATLLTSRCMPAISRRLIVSLPPRHLKSHLASIAFSAWFSATSRVPRSCASATPRSSPTNGRAIAGGSSPATGTSASSRPALAPPAIRPCPNSRRPRRHLGRRRPECRHHRHRRSPRRPCRKRSVIRKHRLPNGPMPQSAGLGLA